MQKSLFASLASMFAVAFLFQATFAHAQESTTPTQQQQQGQVQTEQNQANPSKENEPSGAQQAPQAPGQQGQGQKPETEKPSVKLTEKQKAELIKLYNKKMRIESRIIDKYVKYGVLTKEAADKIREHKEQWFLKLQESGFVMPQQGVHKKPAQ